MLNKVFSKNKISKNKKSFFLITVLFCFVCTSLFLIYLNLSLIYANENTDQWQSKYNQTLGASATTNLKTVTSGVPNLSSITLKQQNNGDVEIKWQGEGFINNPDILEYNLEFIPSLGISTRYNIPFLSQSNEQQTSNSDSSIVPVCSDDTQIQTCIFTILSDGINLDNSTDLSDPSPQTIWKTIEKRGYEIHFSAKITDVLDPVIFNDDAGVFLDYTPSIVVYPNFNDLSTLPKTRSDAINEIAKINITQGSTCATPNTDKRCYKPNDKVNRGAMAEFMRSVLGKPETTKPDKNIADNSDDDTNINLNEGRHEAIKWLAAEDVTSGTQSGTYTYGQTTYTCTPLEFCYKPWDIVNRGAMAEFLWNLAGRPTITNRIRLDGISIISGRDYTVVDSTGQVNKNRSDAILWMAARGITVGSSCGLNICYKPSDKVNRGAMAEFLYRFYQMLHSHDYFSNTIKSESKIITPASAFSFMNTDWKRVNIRAITFSKTMPATNSYTLNKSFKLNENVDDEMGVQTKPRKSNLTDPIVLVCNDLSILEDNSVLACSNDNGVNITIHAKGGVRANSHSQNLFSDLFALEELNGVVKADASEDAFIDTNTIIDMSSMFYQSKFPSNVTQLPTGFGSAATNMNSMFCKAKNLLHTLEALPTGFGSSATDMNLMFSEVELNDDLTFPAGFGSSATDMKDMFRNSFIGENLISFPAGFGSKAVSMENMFYRCDLGLKLISFPDGFGEKADNTSFMFYEDNFPTPFTTFGNNFTAQAKTMAQMFAFSTFSVNFTSFDDGFGAVATEMFGLFYKTDFGARTITFPVGFGALTVNMENMFYETTFPVGGGISSFLDGFGNEALYMKNMFNGVYFIDGITFPVGFGTKTTNTKSMFKNATLECSQSPFPDGFASKVTSAFEMFYSTNFLVDKIVFGAKFATNAVDTESMFDESVLASDETVFPSGFGAKTTNMKRMFASSTMSETIVFPSGFGAKTTNMSAMFDNATLPSGLTKFPDGFGANCSNMSSMFADATLKTSVDWTNLTSVKADLYVSRMFNRTIFNTNKIKVANSKIQTKFTGSETGGSTNDIVL